MKQGIDLTEHGISLEGNLTEGFFCKLATPFSASRTLALAAAGPQRLIDRTIVSPEQLRMELQQIQNQY
jgi:hypothetical protein